MNGRCRACCIVYKATLKTRGETKNYFGCSETEFKTRFYNHNQSFKNQNKRNTTELSKSVWKTKEEGHEPIIHWSIVTKTKPYKPGSKLYQLCSAEKLTIQQSDPSSMLNKRSELYGKCRHKNKFKLKNLQV